MTPPPLPRWRVVVCTDCGSQLFWLRFRAGPVNPEVRRHAATAFQQAQLAHWQRCDGVVFVAIDAAGKPLGAVDELEPQEAQPEGDSDMTDGMNRHLEITPEALKTIAAMHDRANAIGLEYGKGSPEHLVALESLVTVYGHMIRLGGRIMREGLGEELCLIGVTVGHFTYGVFFRPKKLDGDRRDPLLGEWELHS